MGSAMNMSYDLILRGGWVVNHDGEGLRALAVKDGRIAAIGDVGGSADEIVDCRGLAVLPGVIDTQVHFREPGLTTRKTWKSGSRAAVMGGVTAVFEMPNTDPLTTGADALADKLRRGRHRMHCDFAFFIGGTRENTGELPDLERLPGCAGVKVFMGSSTGSLLVRTTRACAHPAGNPAPRRLPCRGRISSERAQESGSKATHARIRSGATICRVDRDRRLLRLARETGKRVHVLHVSTAEEMDLLETHKDVASVEVTPHHLTLEAPSCYERLGTRAQMNPPVRDAAHRAAIWRALADGVVDVLGSDHAPHTAAEKEKSYPASPSGMTGVQTLVPIMLDHVNAGRLSLMRLVDLTSAGPARLFGIAGKGRIAVGYDADLTVVDLKRRQTISNGWIASRAGWTPYDGVAVTGWPVGTFVRGRKVMWENELLTPAQGEPVRFVETLAPVETPTRSEPVG